MLLKYIFLGIQLLQMHKCGNFHCYWTNKTKIIMVCVFKYFWERLDILIFHSVFHLFCNIDTLCKIYEFYLGVVFDRQYTDKRSEYDLSCHSSVAHAIFLPLNLPLIYWFLFIIFYVIVTECDCDNLCIGFPWKLHGRANGN